MFLFLFEYYSMTYVQFDQFLKSQSMGEKRHHQHHRQNTSVLSFIHAFSRTAGLDNDFFPPNRCNWAVDPRSELCKQASKDAILRVGKILKGSIVPTCELLDTGSGWGKHALCNKEMDRSDRCIWISFGIADDYSFDEDLEARYPNCYGYLLDPTVTLSSSLSERMLFFKVGATALNEADNEWTVASLPTVHYFVGGGHIEVLKMDCEGCEYAIARDVAMENPRLLREVTQFALEIHISKFWITSQEEVFHLGMLYEMLDREGFHLQHSSIHRCAKIHESYGCSDELVALGYPCGIHQMCHNYLFSK